MLEKCFHKTNAGGKKQSSSWMQVKHSLSLVFVLFFRKHVFISLGLLNEKLNDSYSKWSGDGGTENVMLV